METLKCSLFNIFILILFLSFLSAGDCLEIKKDHHQSARDDVDDGRKNAFTTRNPLDLDSWYSKRITFQPGDDLDWWKKLLTTRAQGDDFDDWKKNTFTTRNPLDLDPWDLKRITFQPGNDLDWWKKLFTTREQGDDIGNRWKRIFTTRKPSELCKWDLRQFTLYPGQDTKYLEFLGKKILNCDPSDFTRSDFKKVTLAPRIRWFTTPDPLEWRKRITYAPPKDYNYLFKENSSNSGIYLAVGLVSVFLCICILVSMKYYYEERGNNSFYGRPATSNSTRNSDTRVSPLSTVSQTLPSDRPHLVIEFTNETDSSSRRNVLDRPPKYDDVVISDSTGAGKFQQVSTSVPETPPPEYNAGTKRY